MGSCTFGESMQGGHSVAACHYVGQLLLVPLLTMNENLIYKELLQAHHLSPIFKTVTIVIFIVMLLCIVGSFPYGVISAFLYIKLHNSASARLSHVVFVKAKNKDYGLTGLCYTV